MSALVENIAKFLNRIAEETKKQKYAAGKKQDACSYLAKAYHDDRLVLVIGAGVSMEHGLPSWNILLQKLIIKTFSTTETLVQSDSQLLAEWFLELFKPSPLIAARYLNLFFGRSPSKTEFEKAVRDAIYEEIKIRKDSRLLSEIKQFCAAAGKNPTLNSIITYNYDDIIEQSLRESDIEIPFKSVFGIGIQAAPHQLPIYHVHGFLPKEGKLTKANIVTLSEDVYHNQYTDIYSWNNIVQINKFRDNICLFIGSSFTDPNLRRLLDIAKCQKEHKTRHFMLKKAYDRKSIATELKPMVEKEMGGDDADKKSMHTPDEAAELLIDNMQAFEERDAESFDVEIIWVEDYKQIPDVLKKIRCQEVHADDT